ncbi:hypothetical protein MPSEU_000183500 [Mayamaea pseudoterrestris]|nr:hypothetical protein MPSEU_000183500 [Mayamaea pseudoterrestris]
MTLQHQYDDGRATSTPEQEEARKKEVMAEMADDADDSSDDEVIPKLALRPAHEQEFFDDEIEEAAINAVSGGLTGIAHITPHADDHKGGEALDDIRIGSVAPSSLHRRMLPSETRRSGILQRSGETAVERVGMMANSFDRYRNGAHELGGSQAGLDRYGFASMRSSSQTVSVQSLEEVEQFTIKRNSDASMSGLHSKRQRRSALNSTAQSDLVNRTAVTTGDGGDEAKAEQRRVSLDRCRSPPSSADDDEQEDGDDDDDDVTQPALPTQDHPQRETSSIVFDAFTGTDDAVLMSRRERLALRDRRLRYENTAVSLDHPEVQTDIISLSKEDFSSMRVIGQFNLGFLLAVSQDCNLWILDQHACDEKFNFEKLMAETIITEQRLISPMPLELMPAEESCIMDNMEIFEKNGFRFKVDWDKQPRHRLSLTALPHSGAPDGRKAVQFGKEDVSALCHILGVDESSASHDGAAGTGTGADGNGLYGNNAVRRYTSGSRGIDPAEKVIVRLPKAIAMFASRACRGSIMIGQALSQKDMDRIVRRLQDVEHPWNCPHGRPTMRHVLALECLLRGDDQKARELIGDTATTMMSQDDADAAF